MIFGMYGTILRETQVNGQKINCISVSGNYVLYKPWGVSFRWFESQIRNIKRRDIRMDVSSFSGADMGLEKLNVSCRWHDTRSRLDGIGSLRSISQRKYFGTESHYPPSVLPRVFFMRWIMDWIQKMKCITPAAPCPPLARYLHGICYQCPLYRLQDAQISLVNKHKV